METEETENMSVAGPVGAVSVGNPLSGVKRPLQSNPVRIPSNLPANRGKDVQPGGVVKAPPLKPGNLQNRGTNVTIPYARVCPFYPDQPRLGRVSAGDVLFVDKEFLGELDAFPSVGVGTRSHCLGLDAVNRRLHGNTHPEGWVDGVNCFRIPKNADVDALFARDRVAKDVLMTELERFQLDGVVLSNDERDTYNAASSQQNVVFNVAVQGRALVNNGYAAYDSFTTDKEVLGYQVTARPETNARNVLEYKKNGVDVRKVITSLEGSVEAYPRGSVEHALRNSMNGGRDGFTRPGDPIGYPASANDVIFTGFYARYPLQMFDRAAGVGDTLYVGLRVYRFGDDRVGDSSNRVSIRRKDSKDPTDIYDDTDADKTNGAFCFAQYICFTGRQAHLCARKQKAEEAVIFKKVFQGLGVANGFPPTAAQTAELAALERKSKELDAKLSEDNMGKPFGKYEFDCIRQKDFSALAGVWTVGRIMDNRATRLPGYDVGPEDTAMGLTVDVSIAWYAFSIQTLKI